MRTAIVAVLAAISIVSIGAAANATQWAYAPPHMPGELGLSGDVVARTNERHGRLADRCRGRRPRDLRPREFPDYPKNESFNFA